MAEIVFVIDNDGKFSKEIDELNVRMNRLHDDYDEHHTEQGLGERIRKSLEYKAAYIKWRYLRSKRDKRNRYWMEVDGRVFDIDWHKMGSSKALRHISSILRAEEETKIEEGRQAKEA